MWSGVFVEKKKAAGCEDRTHDLGIMRPTLFQLSQTRLVCQSILTFMRGRAREKCDWVAHREWRFKLMESY